LNTLALPSECLDKYQYPVAENRIAVVGATTCERTLINRLVPDHHCSFVNEYQLGNKSTVDTKAGSITEFDAIVFVYQRSSSQPIPTHLFNHSKRIIIISSCVDENIIVQALYAGADYYLNINESERVLSSRFAAALRSHANAYSKKIEFAPYTFDLATHTIYKDSKKIFLTHREFELALYLFSNKGKLIKDSDLLTCVWGLSPSVGTRRISTTVYQVNKKLRLQSASAQWDLKRYYAKGYRLIDKQHPQHFA